MWETASNKYVIKCRRMREYLDNICESPLATLKKGHGTNEIVQWNIPLDSKGVDLVFSVLSKKLKVTWPTCDPARPPFIYTYFSSVTGNIAQTRCQSTIVIGRCRDNFC